jgi:hypothetical protein
LALGQVVEQVRSFLLFASIDIKTHWNLKQQAISIQDKRPFKDVQ